MPIFYLQYVTEDAVSHQRPKEVVARLFERDDPVRIRRHRRRLLMLLRMRWLQVLQWMRGRHWRPIRAFEKVLQVRKPVNTLLHLVDALHVRQALHDPRVPAHTHDGVRPQEWPLAWRYLLLEPRTQL